MNIIINNRGTVKIGTLEVKARNAIVRSSGDKVPRRSVWQKVIAALKVVFRPAV